MKLPLNIKIIIGVVAILILLSLVNTTYICTTNLYNATVDLRLENDKVIQKQVSNYDGYYQAFIDEQSNANINKETFIQVTDIIMSNRKDGQSLAWKWTTENQQIPYNEFTDFYRELSSFIRERYADNMKIEQEKQAIVQQHNLLLQKWPNNFINKLLSINPLVYKAGYISDYTKSKFK